nr:hypothetical protein [Tanacetum cinerariifolium]
LDFSILDRSGRSSSCNIGVTLSTLSKPPCPQGLDFSILDRSGRSSSCNIGVTLSTLSKPPCPQDHTQSPRYAYTNTGTAVRQ